MARRVALFAGIAVAVFAFAAGLAALALPWARYSVRAAGIAQDGTLSLFNLARGGWYLAVLLAAAAALVAAATGRGWFQRFGGILGVLLGIVGTLLAVAMVNELAEGALRTSFPGLVSVDSSASLGPAVLPAILAPFLLGFAAALFAAARVTGTSGPTRY